MGKIYAKVRDQVPKLKNDEQEQGSTRVTAKGGNVRNDLR